MYLDLAISLVSSDLSLRWAGWGFYVLEVACVGFEPLGLLVEEPDVGRPQEQVQEPQHDRDVSTCKVSSEKSFTALDIRVNKASSTILCADWCKSVISTLENPVVRVPRW